MDEKNKTCHCPCFCDPAVPRMFEQSGARFNEMAGFATHQGQLNFIHMSNHHLSTAQNEMEKHGTADMILQLRAIQGQPGGA